MSLANDTAKSPEASRNQTRQKFQKHAIPTSNINSDNSDQFYNLTKLAEVAERLSQNQNTYEFQQLDYNDKSHALMKAFDKEEFPQESIFETTKCPCPILQNKNITNSKNGTIIFNQNISLGSAHQVDRNEIFIEPKDDIIVERNDTYFEKTTKQIPKYIKPEPIIGAKDVNVDTKFHDNKTSVIKYR